jgi:serine/threonine protein kinase
LGMGAYKRVYLGFDQEEGVEVAWNELRIDHLQPQDVTKVLAEVQILQSLRHDSIINLYHCWTAREESGRDQVYFITELMTSGTLKAYIRKTKGTLKPKVIKNWSRQILKGLEYLHSRDPPIIHRDLKVPNNYI